MFAGNPLCVRVLDPAGAGPGAALHVMTGTPAQNMPRMGRLGRGGGRPPNPLRGEQLAARVRRWRALREAVRGGWDAEAVAAALLNAPDGFTLWQAPRGRGPKTGLTHAFAADIVVEADSMRPLSRDERLAPVKVNAHA